MTTGAKFRLVRVVSAHIEHEYSIRIRRKGNSHGLRSSHVMSRASDSKCFIHISSTGKQYQKKRRIVRHCYPPKWQPDDGRSVKSPFGALAAAIEDKDAARQPGKAQGRTRGRGVR